jgi:guanylate kinase
LYTTNCSSINISSNKSNIGKCIIIAAPSGAGKTTIVNYLKSEIPSLALSVSITTRSPRSGEIDGDHYSFVTVERFKEYIESNLLLEWEEVYPGQFYGTLKSEIDRIWSQGKSVIFDMDADGGINLKKEFGAEALTIFLSPPSIKVLEDRLISRGTETKESILKRIHKAESEIKKSEHYDIVAVNRHLEETQAYILNHVENFIKGKL